MHSVQVGVFNDDVCLNTLPITILINNDDVENNNNGDDANDNIK